ncbi:reverse transcriptase domain-containing protein, partial [Tanacetum coccineum]
MLQATQPTTIESAILTAGILTDEEVRCGTLSKGSEKMKEVEETSKQGGSRNDNKRAKVGKGFMVAAPYRNEYIGSYCKCAKCLAYHLDGELCRLCYNCQKPGHFARNNGNQARGRAFNVNEADALQYPKVVMDVVDGKK